MQISGFSPFFESKAQLSGQNYSIVDFLKKLRELFNNVKFLDKKEFEGPSTGMDALRKLDAAKKFLDNYFAWQHHLLPTEISQLTMGLKKLDTEALPKNQLPIIQDILRNLKDKLDLRFIPTGLTCHTVLMRPMVHYSLDLSEIPRFREYRASYNLALLRATLVVAGVSIVDVKHEEKSHYQFVRDPLVLLHDLKLILFTKGIRRKNELIEKYLSLGYKILEIENAYMEGGNVIYDAKKKVILHGLNPIYSGYTKKPTKPKLDSDEIKVCYYIPPEKTNQQLENTLKKNKIDISVHGISLNPDLVKRMSREIHQCTLPYYHLDCFMQLLPDGRLIILNKEMLSNCQTRTHAP